MPDGWIGVDLDSTLAEYDVWRGIDHIGKPIPAMVNRIKKWLTDGHTVKIFTARVAHGTRNAQEAMLAKLYIQQWLTDVAGLPALEVTNVKDSGMFKLWDDRCIQVMPNTGEPLYVEDTTTIPTQEYERLIAVDRRMPKRQPTVSVSRPSGTVTIEWPEDEHLVLVERVVMDSLVSAHNTQLRLGRESVEQSAQIVMLEDRIKELDLKLIRSGW